MAPHRADDRGVWSTSNSRRNSLTNQRIKSAWCWSCGAFEGSGDVPGSTAHDHLGWRRAGQPSVRMDRIATRWLPPARVMHPYPEVRFAATYPR